MTVKTKTGKEFECDFAAENPYPPRLYLHILDVPLGTLAAVFTSPDELPIEGEKYSEYIELQSISVTADGVNVTLKKTGS